MSITKRITKFLLIAALAIPAWNAASAQKPTAPPEMAPTENQVREKAKDLKGLSVATRNSESRPVGKSVSINASNAIKLSTPISKVKVSTAPDGPKVKGVKPVNAVNSDAKTGQPRRTSAPQLKAPELRTDVPDGYALIVFVVGDVWGDGSGYQMLLDKDATMYASWYNNGSPSLSQSIYDMADYKIPENADYDASGNATNFLVNQTGQVVVPAGTYDILITNPTPGDKVYAASANGNIGGRIDDYAIAAGNVYTFTVSLGGTNDQTDVEITSVADMLETPTNLVADPGVTSANISWEAGMNNEGWNLRYRPYVDKTLINRLWDLSVDNYLEQLDEGWFVVDNDNDSKNWDLAYNSNAENDLCFYSFSFDNGTSYDPDNWLISPAIGLGGTLKFKLWNRNSSYKDKVAVYLYIGNLDLNSNLSINDFVKISDDYAPGTSPTEYTLSLSSYSGVGHLLFRHYDSYDKYSIYLDDIEVTVPNPVELPEWIYVNDVTNPYTITGLTSNTTYEVQVQGVGNNTTTDWTNSVVFTTLESIDPTTELDFGSVDVESSKTLSAYIANDSDSPVTAAVTVAPNPPFSVAETTVTLAANTLTSIPVTFTPSEARSYTGTLTVVAGDVTTTIPLKGVGNMSGPEAVRDSAFYAGISYKWPINVTNPTDTSRLDEVATDPDQMIALIREVYTNKSIPGNFKRGYANTGGTSYFGTHDNNVQYTGAGLIERDGSYVGFSDAYGWDIPSDSLIIGSSNSISYAYMNPYQYKPDNEGVTLLLLEMVDDFDPNNVTVSATGYAGLKELFSKTLKSVRVITQAKRTGEGESRGTLFNIDCDKMNKFYLLAKGQLGWLRSAWFNHQSSTFTSFYTEPCYIYSSSYDEYADPALEKFFFLGHMFEQFSPASPNATATELDLYRKMTTGDSFPVVHDCPNVPYIESGHHFMMYGTESGAADCQDVRDLMFFVPDYRMMDHADRGSKSSSSSLIFQDYFEYHPNHQPTMGLYVIIQDSVEAVTRADSYYKLKLTWDSNMDEFMPGDQQEYQLYQVVTDEFGVSKWVPVYKRNAQGQYWNPTTNAWQADTTGAEHVVLTMNPSADKKTYAEVYEMRENSGRIVTYAVRGQDTGHFLSLQMSNEESYFIPGTDPAEMALMSSATIYSRYEAQNENNCYSNKLLLKSSPRTIKTSYLPHGSTMTINRTHRVRENGQSVEVTVPIATLTVGNGYFTVSGSVVENQEAVKALFPKGTHDGLTAGYHANTLTNGNQIAYTTETVGGTEYMNFDIPLWDNFVADVSKNEHPGLYIYQLVFNTAESFTGLNGLTNEAYSNYYPVYVYKTDSQINKPLTLEQVNGDTGCSDAYKPGDVEFSAQVMLSSKSEILRYDAYRWNEGAERSIVDYGGLTDEDEEDYDPNGIAGNQGDSYSVTMNAIGSDDYYVGNAVSVTDAAPQNWAKFVDYYPAKQPNGGAFTYAPVVELFTRGYVEGSTTKERGDYNTYGGPLKTTAVGKLELEIPDNLNTAGNPFMSTYKWLDGEDWCAYYKIPVKFKVLGIPEGYELYKIRAWRDVDTKILREELTSRQDRIAPNYLFEELTYGDALGDGHTMSKANLYQNNDGTVNSYELGRRAVENYDADSNIQGETHATFGALRINTKDNQPYSIDNLEATIKVRAYFTKTSNPIFSNPIYVICDTGVKDENNNSWGFSNPVGTLICEDGANFTGTVTIPEGADGSHKGYFMFSKQLGSSWTNNPQYIFGPEASGNEVLGEWPNNAGYNLKYWQGGTKVFEVYPGTYKLSIGSHVQDLETSAQYGYQAGYITITRVANSKAPTRDLVPADYGYYVADGEVEFNSNMFNQIITGVTDVTTNSTREVMSVSYVNTIGQVSSTPWKGVNMVVTRYTDGSTSTTKVMK